MLAFFRPRIILFNIFMIFYIIFMIFTVVDVFGVV